VSVPVGADSVGPGHGPASWTLLAGYPVGKGDQIVRVGRYLPFAPADVAGSAAELMLRQFSGTLLNLRGIAWTGPSAQADAYQRERPLTATGGARTVAPRASASTRMECGAPYGVRYSWGYCAAIAAAFALLIVHLFDDGAIRTSG
jgi:hypothetical protein